MNIITCLPIVNSQTELPVFKYGVGGSPETIDPAQAWDSDSIDILDQVMEGLVTYDLFDPEMEMIPCLATNVGIWNAEAMEVTFTLRHNVTFHDGTPFDANVVKYSFDRLNHLIEAGKSQIKELYEPLALIYPDTPFVINETVIVDDYTVKFVLNYPYAPFTALLCFSGSYIVHPDMPFDRLIKMNEPLYGTGPYVLESYTTEETHFTAYEYYWRAQPQIQEMLWILYDDDIARQQALLAGDIHMVDEIIYEYLEEYESNPLVTVHEPQSRATIQYLGMNNKIINKTLRQAISYAIDYDYLIDMIKNGLAVRMVSPIPSGIKFHDPTVQPAYLNVTIARQILTEAGLSKGLSAVDLDWHWLDLTESNPIAVFNYTYNIGNRIQGDLGLLLVNNLAQIGIQISVIGLTWPSYLECITRKFDRIELYMIGWAPDFNDPSNYINLLLSNTSSFNTAQVNDSWLQTAMMDALTTINETERHEVYLDIQHYIVEDLMPWVFLFQSITRTVHNKALGNFPRNAMGKIFFYPCIWTGDPYRDPDDDVPHIPLWLIIVPVGGCIGCLSCIAYIIVRRFSRSSVPPNQPLAQYGSLLYCPICNTQVEWDHNFCPNCGAQFRK